MGQTIDRYNEELIFARPNLLVVMAVMIIVVVVAVRSLMAEAAIPFIGGDACFALKWVCESRSIGWGPEK